MKARTKSKSPEYKETLVNFILDKSGSMGSIQEATISGFNEYLNSLKNDGNSYRFSLVLFDTKVVQKYLNSPIGKVANLNKDTYLPAGLTALYDAVCQTIKDVKKTVKSNQKILTVIMTDGEENSSEEYSNKDLKKEIEELEKTGRWSFVFLGANQDSWATGGMMGIKAMNTSNFQATSSGAMAAMGTLAVNTSVFAGSATASTNTFFSKKDQNNLGRDEKISSHFSSLGKRSWEKRKKDLLK